jgi:hypothetical protein
LSLSPTEKKKVRAHITKYCQTAELNQWRWHYSQQRPFRYVNDPASSYVVGDCSAYVSIVYHDCMHDLGIYIADPLGMKYTGWGYTGTLEHFLRANGKRVVEANGYLVGDIARWGEGSHAHTAVCRKAGSAKVAVWSSFGSESGPKPVLLGYRSDLVGVWRHPGLV